MRTTEEGWAIVRACLAACSACLLGVTPARAHPADVTHLLVKIQRHQVEVRLTFNLLTLMRFAPVDSDQNGELTLDELAAAEPQLDSFLEERIPISINRRDGTRLDLLQAMRPVWPASEKPIVKAAEYDTHWIDVDCRLFSEALVEDVWIGFEFFEDTGYAHTIQGFFEQEGNRLEVPFTVQEPEFLYDTGFKPGDEPPPATASDDAAAQWNIVWTAAGLILIALLGGWRVMRRNNVEVKASADH